MPSDLCPVCDRPLADHQDGLACCPYCEKRRTRVVCVAVKRDRQEWHRVKCDDCGQYGPIASSADLARDMFNTRAPTAKEKRLEETERWQGVRLELLQLMQKHMRDHERTMVCDILANGALLHDSGNRYGVATKNVAGRVVPAVPETETTGEPK